MLNLFGERPQLDPAVIARIKSWAVDRFALPPDVSLLVTELRCTEPGCPPLETVIAVLAPGQPTVQYKLHMAAVAVTQADLEGLSS